MGCDSKQTGRFVKLPEYSLGIAIDGEASGSNDCDGQKRQSDSSKEAADVSESSLLASFFDCQLTL
jgi:hypothetical protein